jgi:acyl carrier protein
MTVGEQDVARVWCHVLGIAEADVDAHFFELGGHSLLLLELVGRLKTELGIDTDVLTLLEHPTIAGFTTHWNASAHVDQSR